MSTVDERTLKIMKAVTIKLLKIMKEKKELSDIREAVVMERFNDDKVQIQIIITRDESEILDTFETVETTNYTSDKF